MKNTFKILLFFFMANIALAQTNTDDYNKWSVELSVGQNKAIRPFAKGHYSAQPIKYSHFSNINHFDLGSRYMLSSNFGFKADFGYDRFSNESGSGSLYFKSDLYRVNFQGIANIGRVLSFQSFTGRIGLLAHAGVQVSTFKAENNNEGEIKKTQEDNGGLILGITPQFRLTNRIVLNADFTAVHNIRQHLNWDGSVSDKSNNLTGAFYNFSMGITFYLGKHNVHADWFLEEKKSNDIAIENSERLDELERMLNDTDRDGVPDYLDAENNTPSGVIVDIKGRFIDVNHNQIPDELESRKESYLRSFEKASAYNEKLDAYKNNIESVFYDSNSDIPNEASTNAVFALVNLLKQNSELKVKLTGYADVTGSEKLNLLLSERRVDKLKSFLAVSGIAPNRIEIAANGIDTSFHQDKLGNRLARRVTIEIINSD